MLNAIRDILMDHENSDGGKDGEDENDDTEDPELGKLSEDAKPCRVMGKFSKMLQHGIECYAHM